MLGNYKTHAVEQNFDGKPVLSMFPTSKNNQLAFILGSEYFIKISKKQDYV